MGNWKKLEIFKSKPEAYTGIFLFLGGADQLYITLQNKQNNCKISD